jgi:hypothetical protein
MAHREFGHMGAFAHPGLFAQCFELSRGRSGPQSRSVPASLLAASPVDEPYAYAELPACPDRVEPGPDGRMTLAHCLSLTV